MYHHLDKKYELEEGSPQMALGSILDEAIKKLHLTGQYDCPKEELKNYVMASVRFIREKAAQAGGKPSYFSGIVPHITPEVIERAVEVFMEYCHKKDGGIHRSFGPVEFCKWPLEIDGEKFQLWGWPDAYEIDEFGGIEIVDYKSRENIERGKEFMDMELMPKIYALLASPFLISEGVHKAKFIVRFWQDPNEESFFEDFDLEEVSKYEDLFRDQIKNILNTKELSYCEKTFCKPCRDNKREEFMLELQKLGFANSVMTNQVLDNTIPETQTIS